MNKTWLSLSLLSILLAAGCSISSKPNGQSSPPPAPAPTPVTTTPAAEMIFLQKTDLNGDGKLETVSLTGSDKSDPKQAMSFAKQTIQIEKEGSQQTIEIESEPMGTPMDLTAVDLTGDSKKELVYRMSMGNSKGTVKLYLYTSDADGTYKEMVVKSKHDPDFRLKLLDNRNYELTDPDLGKVWMLKMEEEKIKQTGNPNMTGDKLTIGQPYEWSWTDADQDGHLDLLSKRAVWIKTDTNRLFTIQTIFKWDGQAWISQSYTVQPEPNVQILR
jgi:hypothetical protein